MPAELDLLRGRIGGQALVTVRIGVGELIALTWFDRLLARLRKTHPRVVVDMDVDLVAEELAEGSLIALPSRPAMRGIAYSACHLPSGEVALMAEIAALARAESWFGPPPAGRG